MTYVFLKSANGFQGEYLAISRERIKTLNVSDSYTDYGQKVGADDAGDHLEIVTQRAADEANNLYNAQDRVDEGDFKVGDIVSAFENRGLYRGLEDAFGGSEEIHLHKTTFKGFNYWDGNNWKTVVVDSELGGETHNIEDDEAIIARLNDAIENKEWVRNGFGTQEYKYLDAVVVVNNFASAFEAYSITLDNQPETNE